MECTLHHYLEEGVSNEAEGRTKEGGRRTKGGPKEDQRAEGGPKEDREEIKELGDEQGDREGRRVGRPYQKSLHS
jgi:hypothetical protein